mgnify:CR=1 FL=1
MHIVYLTNARIPSRTANSVQSMKICAGFVAAGHEVTMVCASYGQGKTGLEGPFRRGRRRGMVSGIDVVEFDLSYSNDQGFVRRVGRDRLELRPAGVVELVDERRIAPESFGRGEIFDPMSLP